MTQFPTRPPRRANSSASAFTLIEMLVVIAIIALMSALIAPVVGRAMEGARKTKCLSNARQIAIAGNILFLDLGNDLPVISGCDRNGVIAAMLMQYTGDNLDVFNCPSNPGNQIAKWKRVIRDENGEEIGNMEYAINTYMTICSGQMSRKQHFITNRSEVAFAFDLPWFHGNPSSPHKGGVNVAYLDGRAAWLPDEKMSDYGKPKVWQDANFYLKGHSMPRN